MKEKHIANSLEELLALINNSKKNNKIVIKDVVITFPFDNCCLFKLLGIKPKYYRNITTIRKQMILDNVEFCSFNIQDLMFQKRVIIRSSKIEKIWINNCRFCESFSIMNYDKEVIRDLKILNSHYYKDVNLILSCQTQIDILNVEDSYFKNDFNISGVQMSCNASNLFYIAERTKIDGSLSISNSTLFETVKISCKITKNLRIENVNYNVITKISKELFAGRVEIFDSDIGGTLSLKKCAFISFGVADSVIADFCEHEFYYKALLEDAARIIYCAPTINSDPVKKDKYQAELYERRFKDNIKDSLKSILNKIDNINNINNDNKTLKKLKKKWWKSQLNSMTMFFASLLSLKSSEQLILFFNKYSNNYNRSWFRGIVFTNVVAVISYFLINYFGTEKQFFVIDWTFVGFGDVLLEYIRLIDVFGLTNFNDNVNKDCGLSLNSLGTALLFVARIFIIYGCWQTIYAFYKYQKN